MKMEQRQRRFKDINIWLQTQIPFEQIEVFVAGSTPLLTPERLEELQESGERVFVEFENAVVKPYYSERTHSIEDSIKADAVHLVETK